MKPYYILLLFLAWGCREKKQPKPGITIMLKVDTEIGGKIDTGRIYYRNYAGDTTVFDTIHLHGMNWDKPFQQALRHMDSTFNKLKKELSK